MSYFRMGTPTLSSALSGFTSEFGMGSGGSHSLLPPGKALTVEASSINAIPVNHIIRGQETAPTIVLESC